MDMLAPKLWLVSTKIALRSGDEIIIVVTENPQLHPVWFYDRIYIYQAYPELPAVARILEVPDWKPNQSSFVEQPPVSYKHMHIISNTSVISDEPRAKSISWLYYRMTPAQF